MKRLVFAPLATRDIDEIYDFSAERWGVQRAERYTGTIRARCEALAAGTLDGRSAGAVRAGYRRVTAGSHVVFYRETAQVVTVVRVLHERMDFAARLDEG